MADKKNKKKLGTYGILILVLLIVAIISWCANGQTYVINGEEGVVAKATISQILMAPILGFDDAREVIGFVFALGAFLALVTATGALDAGIAKLVRKKKGKEMSLVAILMFLFSIGGTTYGMGEETVGFYILLAATMTTAGMDPLVGCATVLLGAGTGVLGSTINPFATGVAIESATSVGVAVNTAQAYTIAVVLWIGSYIISLLYTKKYAKKVLAGGGSILTKEQLATCKDAYGNQDNSSTEMTGKQKACLWLFAFTFVVMILAFIPWPDVNPGVADALAWSSCLTGTPFGEWWFFDAATWFLLMGLIIGFIGLPDRSKIVDIVMAGIADMISVNVVIALARATSVLMAQTNLGSYLVFVSVTGLTNAGMSSWLFGFLDYLLHIALSFLVPSSSGLAGLSAPIVSPIVAEMGWSVETSIMILVAANGLVNLFTPTCGFIMGGLALARVPYEVWINWSKKLILTLAAFSAIVLTLCMAIL